MDENLRVLLMEIIRRVVNAVQPEQIIMFGSYAKGEASQNSDLDLLVIESEPFNNRRSRYKEVAKLEKAIGNIPVATDILVYSREEVDDWSKSPNHVVSRALREGSILYARP